MPGRTLPRTLALALVAIWAVFFVAGCEESPQLTLREAEDLAHAWLQYTEETLSREMRAADVSGAECDPDDYGMDADAWGPETLRDCFVDDGWDAAGFKNPTEVINWLTESKRSFGRVKSIDLSDEGSIVIFEMIQDDATLTLTARIVVENELPKCVRLQKSS